MSYHDKNKSITMLNKLYNTTRIAINDIITPNFAHFLPLNEQIVEKIANMLNIANNIKDTNS